MNQPLQRRNAEHEVAFEALFRDHYRELCAFTYRYVRCRAVAEEVVQDVFLRIWKRRDEMAPSLVRRAYLYRAARNHALRRLDRTRLEEKWKQRSRLALAPVASSPDEESAVRVRAAAVQRAVDMLPPRCKEVFLAVRIQGLRYAEVGRMLGISHKTVEAQMVRAVKLLRERLAENGPD